jgi:hypothetical protein
VEWGAQVTGVELAIVEEVFLEVGLASVQD